MGIPDSKYLKVCVLSLAVSVVALAGESAPIQIDKAPAAKPEVAVAVRKVDKTDPDKLYFTAKKQELSGQYKQAMGVYRMAVNNGATGVAREQAFLGLARCEYQLGNYWNAFKAIESSYPASFSQKAVRLRASMEMDLAARLREYKEKEVAGAAGKDGKALNGYNAAAAVYDRIVYNDPKGRFAREALRLRAECLKADGDLEAAERSLRLLVNTFPNSEEASKAQPDLVELLAERSKVESDGLKGEKQLEAIDRLRQSKTVKSNDPEFKKRVEKAEAAVRESEASYKLLQARSYIKRGGGRSTAAARFLLKDILQRYGDTAVATEAEKLLSKIGSGNGEG